MTKIIMTPEEIRTKLHSTKSADRTFLEHCLATADGDTPLAYVSENSLRGKYVKLR